MQLACVLPLILTLACGGGDPVSPPPGGGGPPATYSMQVASGDGQSGPIATTLAHPVSVKVLSGGTALANARVTFSVTAGLGAVTTGTAHTDADGIAETQWTLGTTAGSNTLVAAAPDNGGVSVRFTATGTPGAGSGLRVVSGSGQSDTIGRQLAPFVAQVLDAGANPVPNEPVDWIVSSGAGTLTTRLVRTDAQGRASSTLTLSQRAGAVAVTATISRLGNRTLAFGASALPGPIVRIRPQQGDSQFSTPGHVLPISLNTLAYDSVQNEIQPTMDWTSADGTLAAGPNGAYAVWTLAATAGAQHATATVHGSPAFSYTFTAFATAAPSLIARVSAASFQRTAGAGTAIPTLTARVLDVNGQPLSGVPIHWSVDTPGTVTPTGVTSDANGLASATVSAPGTLARTLGVIVSVTGGQPWQSFLVKTVAAAPASFAAVSGDQQHDVPGAILTLPLTGRVKDTYGNGVPGIALTWDPPTGGAVLTQHATVSDSDGAAVALLQLGMITGPASVAVHAAGVAAPLTFTASADGGGYLTGVVSNTHMGSLPLSAPLYTSARFTAARRPRLDPSVSPIGTDEVLVIYRSSALGTPEVGSAALAASARGGALAARLRSEAAATAGRSPARLALQALSPALLAARMRVLEPGRMRETIAALRADPAVLTVEPNGLMHRTDRREALDPDPRPRRLPNDPRFGDQAWHYGMIDLPEAWTLSTGSTGVLVAVVDDGARFDHPGLAGVYTSDGYDFVSPESLPHCDGSVADNAGDGDGYDPDPSTPDDLEFDARGCWNGSRADGGHGTHVAGTIGATGNDGVGVTGGAWSVRIRPVRALGIGGVGHTYDIAQAILYAAGLPADDGHGGTIQAASAARVINLSLGAESPSSIVEYAIEAAQNAGALIVAAAGNTGSAVAQYPAWYPGVVAVGALDPSGDIATYSSWGAPTFVLAPGGDVTLVAGGGVTSTAYNFQTRQPIYSGDWDGTSMAAPHVTALAALLLAQQPGLSVAALRSRITDYATPIQVRYVVQMRAVNAWQSLTQTPAPPVSLVARVIDAVSGRLAGTTSAAGGSFRFDQLAAGDYVAFVGEQEGNGGIPAIGRRWSAEGGAGHPALVHVTAGAGNQTSIDLALASEQENDNTIATSDFLPVGAYLDGTGPAGDDDYYRIPVPAGTTMTVSVGAVDGICGSGLEAGVTMSLLRSDGSLLAMGSTSPTDPGVCGQVVQSLAAGTYFARVTVQRQGRYRIQAF